jgi:hypothetical protein
MPETAVEVAGTELAGRLQLEHLVFYDFSANIQEISVAISKMTECIF